MFRALLLAAAALAVTTSLTSSPRRTSPTASPQPTCSPVDASSHILLECAFRADVAALASELAAFSAAQYNATLNVTVLEGVAFTGVAVSLPAALAPLLQAALRAPTPPFAAAAAVLASHEDVIMTQLGRRQASDAIRGGFYSAAGATTTQPAPSTLWALARISSRASVIDGTYVYSLDGSGVDAYVIDGGLNLLSTEFTGRVTGCFNAVADQPTADCSDCDGHGTHVTGLLAGTTFGVAKKANVIPVRVYGCSDAGPVSTILVGINSILRRMASRPRTRAVINMSFGGGSSVPLNNAVAQLVAAGAVVVAAAGNSADDACAASPAGAAESLTVAAIDSFNVFASFSNRGPCVDLAAPGVAVTSAWVGSPTATMVLSGTSMAAPLAAGVAALVLQAFPDASPATVRDTLSCEATSGIVVGVPPRTSGLSLYSPPNGFVATCSSMATPGVPGYAAGAARARVAPVALLALTAATGAVVALALGRATGDDGSGGGGGGEGEETAASAEPD